MLTKRELNQMYAEIFLSEVPATDKKSDSIDAEIQNDFVKPPAPIKRPSQPFWSWFTSAPPPVPHFAEVLLKELEEEEKAIKKM